MGSVDVKHHVYLLKHPERPAKGKCSGPVTNEPTVNTVRFDVVVAVVVVVVVVVVVDDVVDRFYIALFSAPEQTRCTLVACDSK